MLGWLTAVLRVGTSPKAHEYLLPAISGTEPASVGCSGGSLRQQMAFPVPYGPAFPVISQLLCAPLFLWADLQRDFSRVSLSPPNVPSSPHLCPQGRVFSQREAETRASLGLQIYGIRLWSWKQPGLWFKEELCSLKNHGREDYRPRLRKRGRDGAWCLWTTYDVPFIYILFSLSHSALISVLQVMKISNGHMMMISDGHQMQSHICLTLEGREYTCSPLFLADPDQILGGIPAHNSEAGPSHPEATPLKV